jgi:MFS transporter, PPP family, 3-phenylpropionic acid transporter
MSNSTNSLKLWYAGSIGSLGCMPFLAVILADTGLEATVIAAALTAFPVSMMLGAPLWSILSDLTGKSVTVLRIATALQVAGCSLLYLYIESLPLVVLGIILLALGRSPMGPLSDAMTLEALGDNKDQYGAVRTWGSVSFLVVALLSGLLRQLWWRSPLILGGVMMTLTALLAWRLAPAEKVADQKGTGTLMALVRQPQIAWLLVLVTLHGITLTTYDNLFSLHVEALGYSSTVVGLGVALGVAVEIGVLFLGERLLNRFTPLTLVLIGMASGIPRWALTATAQSAAVLVLGQALHGIGFGVFWVGGVALFARLAPKGFERTAQAFLPTTTFGVGYIISMTMATALMRIMDTRGLFFIMAVISTVASLGMLFLWLIERTPAQHDDSAPQGTEGVD